MYKEHDAPTSLGKAPGKTSTGLNRRERICVYSSEMEMSKQFWRPLEIKLLKKKNEQILLAFLQKFLPQAELVTVIMEKKKSKIVVWLWETCQER